MSLAAQKAQNTLRTFVLIAGLTGLLLVVGQVVGGRSGLVLFAGLAVVMNLAMYWFSAKIALKMSKAVPVSEAEAPELHGMIARLVIQNSRSARADGCMITSLGKAKLRKSRTDLCSSTLR